jgi:hypothetical protein
MSVDHHLAKVAVVAATLLISGGAWAQSEPQAPPPDPMTAEVTRNDTAGVNFLSRRYGLSAPQAREQLALQQEISALAERLTKDDPSHFGGIFVDHKPPFKVSVLLTDAATRNNFRDQLPPQLRQFVQLVPAKAVSG